MAREDSVNKGQANGYPPLDASALMPLGYCYCGLNTPPANVTIPAGFGKVAVGVQTIPADQALVIESDAVLAII